VLAVTGVDRNKQRPFKNGRNHFLGLNYHWSYTCEIWYENKFINMLPKYVINIVSMSIKTCQFCKSLMLCVEEIQQGAVQTI
jgi:hypothetical protein